MSSRIGVRLVLLQALVLVCAFGLAGYVGRLSMTAIAEAAVRDRVLGETRSMTAEVFQKGAAHLPHTIGKRTRLWRGFEYRLAGPDGRPRAGTLPPAGGGWSRLAEPGPGGGRRFLAYSTRLPDGSVLTVGQDLASEREQVQAMDAALFWCGGLGVAAGLVASILLLGGAWRRLAAVLQAAREVACGRLEARVGSGPGEPKDEIDELGGALDAMLDKVGELMDQVREVSTAVAHDLRTPLTRVRHRLEKVRRLAQDEPLRAAVGEIDAELQALLRSFDAMLRLAEIQNASRTGAAEDVDLADIAARVVEAYRPDIEDGGRMLDVRIAPAPARGDRELISQALANLLDNALRHTPAGVPIALATELRADGAALVVTDAGPGVPQAQRAAVLQRFRRLDPSRSGPGSGLGLAIVAAIAERHGASLALGDAGPGLKVELVFPRGA